MTAIQIHGMFVAPPMHPALWPGTFRGLDGSRWCAAGMLEASKQFRRVNGHLHLAALRVALDAYVAAQTVGAVRHDDNVIAA